MSKAHCIHYSYQGSTTGGGPVCALGVNIAASFKPRWPCWTANTPPAASATCERFQAPTDEQLAEEQRKGDEATTRMLSALGAIEEWEQRQPKAPTLRGTISCPCCKGPKLQFLVTAGHLYATCATPECVNFRGNRGRRR
jgi:hypothetical protein